MTKRKNPHVGSRFEDWLKDEGMYEEANTAATLSRAAAIVGRRLRLELV